MINALQPTNSMEDGSPGPAGAPAQQQGTPSAINHLVAQLTRQQQPSGTQAPGDHQDRNASMSSDSHFQNALGQPPLPGTSGLAPIAALNHFTAGFPLGPQQDVLPSLPWFAQMQVRLAPPGDLLCCATASCTPRPCLRLY